MTALFLDTETTGLYPAFDAAGRSIGDDLVEVALIDDDGCVLLDTLVDPRRPIPAEGLRLRRLSIPIGLSL